MYLALSGIAEPVSLTRVLVYFGGMLIGPFILIAGTIFVLTGKRARSGAVLVILGCAILTVTVAYQVPSILRDLADPLIVRPPIGLCTGIVVLTLLVDAGAVQIYRLVRSH